ncbi:MAG: redoxin domain-containing protein [Methylococcales bacterium]|nr:redoxin domain-containing protein [Methylococcales bacterium]
MRPYSKKHNLSNDQRQWGILFFYPKDITPRRSIEACNNRSNFSIITVMNTQLLGINTDDEESHVPFVNK